MATLAVSRDFVFPTKLPSYLFVYPDFRSYMPIRNNLLFLASSSCRSRERSNYLGWTSHKHRNFLSCQIFLLNKSGGAQLFLTWLYRKPSTWRGLHHGFLGFFSKKLKDRLIMDGKFIYCARRVNISGERSCASGGWRKSNICLRFEAPSETYSLESDRTIWSGPCFG